MARSKWYATAKRNYDSGRWDEQMLSMVLERGRITQAEYDEIVGSEDDDG